MIYHNHSFVGYKLWLWDALQGGKPWRSMSDISTYQLESPGIKACMVTELPPTRVGGLAQLGSRLLKSSAPKLNVHESKHLRSRSTAKAGGFGTRGFK